MSTRLYTTCHIQPSDTLTVRTCRTGCFGLRRGLRFTFANGASVVLDDTRVRRLAKWLASDKRSTFHAGAMEIDFDDLDRDIGFDLLDSDHVVFVYEGSAFMQDLTRLAQEF